MIADIRDDKKGQRLSPQQLGAIRTADAKNITARTNHKELKCTFLEIAVAGIARLIVVPNASRVCNRTSITSSRFCAKSYDSRARLYAKSTAECNLLSE